MVNDVFGDYIAQNLKVYLNDIILKCKKTRELPADMWEIFEKIRK